jgi:phage tail-like protein
MPILGTAEDYSPKFAFRVVIDGEDYGSFVTASPLNESEVTPMEINSGTSLVVANQSPGKVKWTPVVLTQGASKNAKMREWYHEVVALGGASGAPAEQVKKLVRIEQLDRDMTTVLETFTHYEAWPSKYSDGDFDAGASEFRIKSVTLTFRYCIPGFGP